MPHTVWREGGGEGGGGDTTGEQGREGSWEHGGLEWGLAATQSEG